MQMLAVLALAAAIAGSGSAGAVAVTEVGSGVVGTMGGERGGGRGSHASTADSSEVGLLVERRLAEDLSIGVGDVVRVSAITGEGEARPFVVEGIFERAADPSRISRNEYEVRLHLPDLESLQGVRDRVDRFAVRLEAGREVEPVARWIESLAYGTQAVETGRVADDASATFRVVSRFQDAIGAVTLLASGIFLLCLMVIRVDERRRDVRTMRLVGISRSTIVRVVLAEAVAVAGLASVAGGALGLALAALVNRYFGAFYDTNLAFAIVTPRILMTAAALGILLGVGAGVGAALRVARLPPQRLGER